MKLFLFQLLTANLIVQADTATMAASYATYYLRTKGVQLVELSAKDAAELGIANNGNFGVLAYQPLPNPLDVTVEPWQIEDEIFV
jgi:hypothetical protein